MNDICWKKVAESLKDKSMDMSKMGNPHEAALLMALAGSLMDGLLEASMRRLEQAVDRVEPHG